MADISKPPWTDEQVAALNEWQANGRMHPFTCGRCRDRLGTSYIVEPDGSHREPTEEEERLNHEHAMTLRDRIDKRGSIDWAAFRASRPVDIKHDDRSLVATNDGWICRTCDYTQDWAHEMMMGLPGDPLDIFRHDRG